MTACARVVFVGPAAGSPHLATNCALHTAFDRATSLVSRETRARRHTSGSVTRDRSISQTREGNEGVSLCLSAAQSQVGMRLTKFNGKLYQTKLLKLSSDISILGTIL